MFKIFKKDDFFNNRYSELKDNGSLAVTSDFRLIELSKNGYEEKDISDYIIIPNSTLTKGNLAFTVSEPAEFEVIDVYHVNHRYIAHEYNEEHDLVGAFYVIDDIQKFKENVSYSYSFITYNCNHTEML